MYFCEIASTDVHHQVLERIVVDGIEVVFFEPLNPCCIGHILAVPVSHLETASSDADITGKVVTAAIEFVSLHHDSDYNIIINKGKLASQTVFHLHVHILPRLKHDDVVLPWPQQHTH